MGILVVTAMVLVCIIAWAVSTLVFGEKSHAKICLNLYCLGNQRKYDLMVGKKCIVGSDHEQCDYVIVGDREVARIQCIFMKSENKLYILNKNIESKVYINGKICNRKTLLCENDIIRLGTCDYRITWQKNRTLEEEKHGY